MNQSESRIGEMTYQIDNDNRTLLLQIPKNLKSGHVNNTKVLKIFDMKVVILGSHGIPFHQNI